MTGRPKLMPDATRLGGSRKRIEKLQRWLLDIPERAYELRCTVKDGDADTVLKSWLRDVVTPEDTPQNIEDTIQDHADEMRVSCRGTVAWVDEQDRVITTQPWKCNPTVEEEKFAGDQVSIIQQQQRHIEALLQYNVRSQSMVLEQMVRVLDLVTSRYENETEISDTRDAEIDELKDQLRQLEASNAEKEDPNVNRVIGLLESAISNGALTKRSDN